MIAPHRAHSTQSTVRYMRTVLCVCGARTQHTLRTVCSVAYREDVRNWHSHTIEL